MYFNQYIINIDGAVAQLARAPALQAGGQEFDSPQLHQKLYNKKTAKNIIGNYKQVVQGKQGKIFEIILVYIEKIMTKFDTAIRSLGFSRKHIEKYIDEIR